MINLFKRLQCLIFGHDCEMTGRHGNLLYELHCKNCNRLYVAHTGYGNQLVPSNKEFDELMNRRLKENETSNN